jgi:cytidine deaminase
MPIPEAKLEELKAVAKNVSRFAYCPYSKFAVGAAVLTKSGKIFTGCNVENASYGLTICAERNAVFQSIALHGECQITALIIYTPTPTPSAPCGACRQVIKEFGPNAQIYSFCDGEKVLRMAIKELLPNSFSSEDINKA